MSQRPIHASRRAWLTALAGCAIAPYLPGCSDSRPRGPDAAGEISLPRLDGGGKWHSTSAGPVLLVNVWATWCAPCREEMDSLQQFHQQHAAQVQVVGISVDRDARLAQEFLLARRLGFVNLHDPERQRTGTSLGVRVLPTTLLIDSTRHIVARSERAENWVSVERLGWIEQHAGIRLPREVLNA